MSAVRIINLLVAAIAGLAIAGTLLDSSEAFAVRLGRALGVALFALPSFFILRALSPKIISSIPKVRVASNVNLVAWGLWSLGIVANFIFNSGLEALGPHFLLFAVAAAFFGLNNQALQQALRKGPSSPTPASTEPIQAPATIITSGSTPAVSKHGSYLMRHWHGDLSLPTSYWVNGFLVSGVLVVAIGIAINLYVANSESLKLASLIGALYIGLIILTWFWAVVGIWRSASNHPARGGSQGWATAAKVAVILGAITMSGQLGTTLLPRAFEQLQIALGKDPMGEFAATISANGRSLIVTGTMREGSASRIKNILEAAPHVRTLVLDSNGGRIHEALLIADLVETKRLTTYVENVCESACTFVFLAGSHRAATPNARIGFHLPSVVGMTPDEKAQMMRETRQDYARIGLPQDFIDRILETQPHDMWHPSMEELRAANVVTRVSMGGEEVVLASQFTSPQDLKSLLLTDSDFGPTLSALDARIPGTLDTAVNNGWTIREAGGNDSEVLSGVRQAIADTIPVLLEDANDEVLLAFLDSALPSLEAARAIGSDACNLLLDGKLDISKTLPRDILEREQTFIALAATSPPRDHTRSYAEGTEMDHAVESLFADMTPIHIEYLADPESYSGEAHVPCDAQIALWERVAALPLAERILVLRNMFQPSNWPE